MAELIRRVLTAERHVVNLAPGRGERHRARRAGAPRDVIILDRGLPDVDGITVLKLLRSKSIATPVLLLTALGSVDDRVAGLDAGADDYLPKPFAFAELIARIRALGEPPCRSRGRSPGSRGPCRSTSSATSRRWASGPSTCPRASSPCSAT